MRAALPPRVASLGLWALFWFAPCAFSAPVPDISLQASPSARAFDSERIASIADSILPQALVEQHVPGAVFSAVLNCEIVVARGYGLADLNQRRPMDPERTFFRIGSIAKSITATVAMHLAERGDLDLNADVRTYLPPDFLATSFEQPITLTHLLTYTAGFGERWTGLGAASIEGILPFDEFLTNLPPPQLRAPGEMRIYNSTGFALAALIMERVTGKPFQNLTHEVLLTPAGMNSQTQVLSPEQVRDLAVGYTFDDEGFTSHPRDIYLHIAPGGDGVATARDMAQFVKLHLGCPNSSQVISPQSRAQMQRTHFTHHPAVAGMALGLEEYRWKGQTWLKKPGGSPGMTTFVAFLPDAGFGFFLGVNADQHPLWQALMKEFGDAFALSAQHQPIPSASSIAIDPQKYVGWYRSLRYAPDNWEKLFSLRQARVSAAGGTELTYRGRLFRPVGEDLFQSEDNAHVLGFRLATDGRVDFLFQDGGDGLEAVSRWESLPVQLMLVGAFAVVFLFALGYALVRLLRARSVQVGAPVFLAGLAALVNLLCLIGIGGSLATLDIWQVQLGTPPAIRISAALALLSCVLAVALAWSLLMNRKAAGVSAADRVLAISSGVCTVLFIQFTSHWNVFGFV